MKLARSIRDRRLFAAGVKFTAKQLELLDSLDETPSQVWACGRRGGKSICDATSALHKLLLDERVDELVRPGEDVYALVVATNASQAALVVNHARGLVKASPVLSRWLVSESQDELRFEHNGRTRVFKAMPCSARGLRGYPAVYVAMDEAAHFVSTEWGDRTAPNVFDATRPSIAQFGEVGMMVVSSSPSGPAGWFADHWHKVARGEMEGWRSWQVSTAEMNPHVPKSFLKSEERANPETFLSEFGAQFEGGSAFFDMTMVNVVEGLEFAEPGEAEFWLAGLDPGGVQHGFGVALLGVSAGRLVLGPVVAIHQELGERTFEAGARARDSVLREVAEMLCRYGATGYLDQHQAPQIINRFRELNARAYPWPMTRERKWLAFKELQARMYAGDLVLPALDPLLSEIGRVQFKLEQGGAKIVLPTSARGHCDMVQGLAMACFQLRHRVGRTGRWSMNLDKARNTLTRGVAGPPGSELSPISGF